MEHIIMEFIYGDKYYQAHKELMSEVMEELEEYGSVMRTFNDDIITSIKIKGSSSKLTL